MAENELTKTARVAANAFMSANYKDKDGNDRIIRPKGPGNNLDLTILQENGGTNSGDSGNQDGQHPSSGVDYYPGSLADGQITGRYLLWSGLTDPTKVTNVSFSQDVGNQMNMIGTGLTLLIHVQKTVMTSGTKGAVTSLDVNYDPKNVVKSGYYTTTAPYPIYVRATSFVPGTKLAITLEGVGEKLNGKNVKAPTLYLTFKIDKTMDIQSVAGYDNDGNTAGATGANYDVIVESISTFSTQTAVAQLPASINLFSGSAVGDIALSGPTDFYENISDGIQITLDTKAYTPNGAAYILLSDIGFSSTIVVPKEELIIGNKYDIPNSIKLYPEATSNTANQFPKVTTHWDSSTQQETMTSLESFYISVNKESLGINMQFIASKLNYKINYAFQSKVLRITPYRK